MKNKYVAPEHNLEAYHCPHCGTYAHQYWSGTWSRHISNGEFIIVNGLDISTCRRCKEFALWLNGKMLFPIASNAPFPTEDMSEDVKEEFSEAREIVNRSPRSACALLRLAVQKLMPHLGEKGGNLNEDIGSLVKKGLPKKIQKALDSVRVIGNNAVHPGQIDLKDDTQTASRLFELVNIIVDVMITQPKKIEDVYKKIPESAKEAIKKRDSSNRK